MSSKLYPLSTAVSLMAGTALADVPNVTVDIAPIHSLVARVMQGVGAPSLIVAAGASPHEYNLRPSEARALQDADIVFWVGPNLTPWLESAINTLASDATAAALLGAEGSTELSFREGASFDAHEHGEHEDHEELDDHDAHQGHDDHDHAGADPHAWLSPNNAAVWLNVIAADLSAADPDNADAYLANAAAGREEIAALIAEIDATLAPVRDRNFIVFHDAYQYFETSFDLAASGAISLSDASDPSPARIADVQAQIVEQNVACVLSEPQFNPGLVQAVMDGSTARTAILDPLGSDLEPGPGLYPQMLRNLAGTLAGCLAD